MSIVVRGSGRRRIARDGPPPTLVLNFANMVTPSDPESDVPIDPGTAVNMYVRGFWATSIAALDGHIPRTPDNAWPYDFPSYVRSTRFSPINPGLYAMPSEGWRNLNGEGVLFWRVACFAEEEPHAVGVFRQAPQEVILGSAVLEPDYMPIEGGLRLRVTTSNPDTRVSVQVAGVVAPDAALQDGWVYATAPPLRSGPHNVTLVQGGQPVLVGVLTYAESLAPSVLGAVDSYVVALHELAGQAASGVGDETRQRIIADRDMRGRFVDDVMHARAAALGQSLETEMVAAVWTNAAEVLHALQAKIADPPIVA